MTVETTTRRSRTVSFLRRSLIALVSAVVFWSAVIMLFENSFIFFPSAYPSGPYDDLRAIPSATEHIFTTSDGVRLHGVYARSDSAVATILFSHGNAGNLSHRFHWMIRMLPLRVNIFMYDYRGYGRSEGEPSEEGIYADARAAYDELSSLGGAKDVPLVLWGRSLGGAVTVDLATERRADALILESTFTSASDVATTAYPFLPFIGSLIRTQLDSKSKIGRLTIPSLHIHGSDDSIIPADLGRRLFDAAAGRKELYLIQGADHNDTYAVGGDEYLRQVRTFLASLEHGTPGSG